MLKKPLLVVPAIPKDDGIKFVLPSQEIFLGSEVALSTWAILELCNGQNSIDMITSRLRDIDENFIKGLLSDLGSLGIVIDSREVYKHFHAISANPMAYPSDITDEEIMAHVNSSRMSVKKGVEFSLDFNENSSELAKLQARRSSCRSFTGEPLSIKDVGDLLDIGYALNRHSVPSAGNLYPMKLFVIALEEQKDFPSGYYEYDNERGRLVLFNENPDPQRISHAFNSIGLPFDASLMLIIAADENRQPYKYSNLGYRFMAIEAGEIAQNIALGAVESGMATCFLGGMREQEVADELQLNDCLLFLAIALGKPAAASTEKKQSLLAQLESEMLGGDKAVSHAWFADDTLADNCDKSYFQFLATAQNGQVASGISTSWSDAKLKAIAEGYERQQSSHFFYDVRSSARELSGRWLDPRVIAPLTDAQYVQFPHLQKFSEDLEIEWVKGIDYAGETVFVPTDLVFYSTPKLKRKLMVDTCSSGFAAYADMAGAIDRGLLEIVERDSLMRSWYEKRSPCMLDYAILPLHLQNRAKYWSSRGHDVTVLDVSQMGVVIIEVVITSDSYPCFVSGASSSLESFNEAAIKAFQEAESRLIYGLNEQSTRELTPEHVHSVLDHEALYAQSRLYHEYLEFLFEGEISKTTPEAKASIDDLKCKLDAVVVNVSEERSALRVVKVLSPKLVPISFGFGAGHYSHHSLTCVAEDARLMPHYFA